MRGAPVRPAALAQLPQAHMEARRQVTARAAYSKWEAAP